MKAIYYTQYGPPEVLQFIDIEKPTPKENQVLVKNYAASLNAYDWHLMRADPFLVRLMGGGLLKPKSNFIGADLAGRIEAVGASVTQFKPGDEVYGEVHGNAGGGCAEYCCTVETTLAPKPANLSFEQAAAVPMASMTALQGLRDVGQVQPGQKVLIQGSSGGVGTFAVQLARHFGAEVTAVCRTDKADQARSLGADHVIDYTKEDFTQNGQQYDLILAVNGYHPMSAYKRALAPKGKYVMAGGNNAQIFQSMLIGPLISEKSGRKLGGVSAKTSQEDLVTLKELLEAGTIVPVIDRIYPLEQTPDALRYLYEGHARGKVVITVAQDEEAARSPENA